jgi:DNA polymerase-3 subunit beta
LTLLKGILATADLDVTITYNARNARFQFENTQLTCRLVDGRYPNYEAVIPKENPNNLRINRASLLSTVKRVAIFANKTTNQIRLKMAGTELAVSAEDIDFSTKAHERHTCDYSGEDLEIGFNARFLTEMLSNLESDGILMELSTPNKAGILFPEDGLQEGEEVLMLVMPVMINS